MTETHRGSVTKFNTAYQSYIQNGKNEQLFQVFQDVQNILLSATEVSKQKYYSRILKKMMDSSTSQVFLVTFENVSDQ